MSSPHQKMIKPTAAHQQVYNQIRRDMQKQHLELHVAAQNRLNSPQTRPMSGSTTSDGATSPTVYSHTGDNNTPLSPNPGSELTPFKSRRGRRKGPLDMEIRIKTAFKRKFKLTCEFHREKRTCCNCYDFSKLEEAYYKSLSKPEKRNTNAPGGGPVRSPGDLGPFGTGGAGVGLVRSYADLGTFGTGGVSGIAPTTLPCYQNIDLPTSGEPPRMNPSLIPVLGLDLNSQDSVTAMVSASRSDPYFATSAAPAPIPGTQGAATESYVSIGCSTKFGNRWACVYQCTPEETRLLTSTNSCTWTGPFSQLDDHFRTTHHPFLPAHAPYSSMCSDCAAISPGWVDQRTCPRPERCSPGSWQKWYWGAVTHQSAAAPHRLTVSEGSGNRVAWDSPSWNRTMAGSSHMGQYQLPYNPGAGMSGFSEHSAGGTENSEAGDGEGKNNTHHVFWGGENYCGYQFDATNVVRRCFVRHWLSSPGKREPLCTLHDPPQISPPLRGPFQLLALLIPAPLLIPYILGEILAPESQSPLPSFTSNPFVTWTLTLLLLGILMAWISIGSHKISTNSEVSKTTR